MQLRKLKKQYGKTGFVIKAITNLVLIVHVMVAPASAEVLDKMGGCSLPRAFKVLPIIFLFTAVFAVLKKWRLVSGGLVSAVIYMVWTLYLYVGTHSILDIELDPVKTQYFQEIQTCPQYAHFGYWQMTFGAIIVFMIAITPVISVCHRRQRSS